MGLYNLFSCNVEVQYKGSIMSKAMLFTWVINFLNVLLPLFIAYRSRGFWLKTHTFYEQPTVHFTYKYILLLQTDDPSVPIVCTNMELITEDFNEEHCSEFQVKEIDSNHDGKTDSILFKFGIAVPSDTIITSVMFLPVLDFQLMTTCPLHMQSTALVEKDFARSPSSFKCYGDLTFYQTKHLQCFKNQIDVKFNVSLINTIINTGNNIIDDIIEDYFMREASTRLSNVYTRTQYGQISNFELSMLLRIPEAEIRYKPSIMQELKWAWPQYLSLVIIFYWVFNKIKSFVFSNRLLMVWKVDPWKRPT